MRGARVVPSPAVVPKPVANTTSTIDMSGVCSAALAPSAIIATVMHDNSVAVCAAGTVQHTTDSNVVSGVAGSSNSSTNAASRHSVPATANNHVVGSSISVLSHIIV